VNTIKDAQSIAEAILEERYSEVDFVIDAIETPDNRALVVRGDLSGSADVRGVPAVVVEGEVRGTPSHPCTIIIDGPVVILGGVRHACIHAQAIYLDRGVSASELIADDEIHVKEDLVDVKVHIGNGETFGREIEILRGIIRSGHKQKENLQQELLFKRQQLVKSFTTTGLVFNLNIGDIVRNREQGLYVNLTSFYNALEHRSEKEIDQALREFFAKAIVGVLTRLNQAYIAQGPANRKAFGGVVQKLQDLVFQTREFDKVIDQIQEREVRFWANLGRFNKNDGALCVQGAVMPELALCFSRLDRNDQADTEMVLHKIQMDLKAGKREGHYEAVLKYNDKAVDMIFIAPKAVHQVNFYAPNDRIMWASNAVNGSV